VSALVLRLDELARDLGRMRRSLESSGVEWSGEYLLQRLAEHVESLDVMLSPTAAALWRTGLDVEQALEAVDARADALDRLLRGGKHPQ
jgi:hypothetical protein